MKAPVGYAVHAYADWSDHVGRRFVFPRGGAAGLAIASDFVRDNLDDALLVDVVDLAAGMVVRARRAVRHPDVRDSSPFIARDDFPKGDPK